MTKAPPPPLTGWSASVVGLKRKLSRALRMGGGPSDDEIEDALAAPDREVKLAMLRRVMSETPRTAREAAPAGAFDLVQRALAQETDAHVVSYLVRVASHTGGSAAVGSLAPHLSHADARVVANTLEALALTGDETAFTLALPLIARDEPRVRATALAVMCRFDRTAALDAMVNYLKNARDAQQRHGALFALRAVGGLPIEMLERLQGEVEDPEVRDALARIREEAAPEGVERMLVRTRHTFALALTGKRHGSIVAALFPRAAMLPFLAAATAVLGLTAALTSPVDSHVDEARNIRPAPAVPGTPRELARARPGARLAPVKWTGTVGGDAGAGFLLSVDGWEVRVELADGLPRPRRGDRVQVLLEPERPGPAGDLAGRATALAVLAHAERGDPAARDQLLRDAPPAMQKLIAGWRQ